MFDSNYCLGEGSVVMSSGLHLQERGSEAQAWARHRPGMFQDTCSTQGIFACETTHRDPRGPSPAFIGSWLVQTPTWDLLHHEEYGQKNPRILQGPWPLGEMI